MKQAVVILKNLLSLSVAEVADKGLIFLSTVYLARVISPDGFGIISFATTFVAYFLLFTNLGFNIVGQREVAKSIDVVKKYADQITSIRLVLATAGFIILCIIAIFLNKPDIVKVIIVIAGLNLFSNAFMMDWVYQGNEKMEFLALRKVLTSLLNLLGIVILVHQKSDIMLAMIITVSSAFINATWLLILYIKHYGKLNFILDRYFLKDLIKSSLPITFSNFFILIYNYVNILMLSLMRNDSETGIYNAGFKFVLLVMVSSSIIQGAFFPILARADSREQRRNVMKIYSNLMFICGTITAILVFTFSDYIILIVYGHAYIATASVLKIMMITVLFMFINTSYFPPLVGWRMEKTVMYIIAIGGLNNLLLNFYMIPKWGVNGAAYSSLISEIIVMIGQSIVFLKLLNKIYLLDFLKYLIIALATCSIGYFIYYNGLNPAISGGISFVLFTLLIFLFKFISIPDIRRYLNK